MIYMLDTNIIIYALNGKYPNIISHFKSVPSSSICVASIVVSEIEYGARKSNDYEKTILPYQNFLSTFVEIPFSHSAALEYGRIRAELEKSGLLIGANDMLIAATAIAEGACLVTHNTKEFSRISGLRIEDWTI